ncbi:MAG: CvpA family protein [Muribaculaceae bacterium]|nr:CvpA family protein [Muribaculaceae bacterium]
MNFSNALYPAIILLVALVSVTTGFRRGITMQLASVLGLAFGAVASRILTLEMSQTFQWGMHLSQAEEFTDFTSNLVWASLIYTVVFWIFHITAPILKSALSIFSIGIFNRLLGAFFSLFANLLWLSIVLNLLLCINPESGLLRYESANDGNLVAAVMEITPAVLGCNGAEDFAHFNQLKEAKSISCNFNPSGSVIITNG